MKMCPFSFLLYVKSEDATLMFFVLVKNEDTTPMFSVDDGYIEEACQQLLVAYERCDGVPRPPEFVAGPAAAALAQMILDLMSELGCNSN